MPSRRQIREAVVQFLYCADLEGGADPTALREPFWDFVTEPDRRHLQLATYRTVQHLAYGREGRLAEFVVREQSASRILAGWPEAEPLKRALERMLQLESSWSTTLAGLARLPKDDDDDAVAAAFGKALDSFFRIDRDLSDQADLAKLRDSRAEIGELRRRADELVDQVLARKEAVDSALAAVVENYAPERIDPVDRAILRLATHELLHTDTPAKVAINEAVELAKRFGTSDSARFVNGVLDCIARRGTATATHSGL